MGQTSIDSALTLRPYTETDLDFIFSSWLSSFKSSHYAGPVPDNVYWKLYQHVLEEIFKRPGFEVTVVCNKDYPDQIVAYLAWEPGIVHYVYVKQPFRQKGIAAYTLMATVGSKFQFTFKTAKSRFFNNSFQAKFNPKPVRRKSESKNHENPASGPVQGLQ